MDRILFVFLLFSVLFSPVLAQPDSGHVQSNYLNFGVGVSGWGIPIYASFEFNVGTNMALDLGGSYQSKNETYRSGLYGATWQHTIVGVQGSFHYYLDAILALPDDFDLYGGASLGYWIWETDLRESSTGFDGSYAGTATGGFGLGIQAGGRYFFLDNLALALELGGGTILSSGRLGLSLEM